MLHHNKQNSLTRCLVPWGQFPRIDILFFLPVLRKRGLFARPQTEVIKVASDTKSLILRLLSLPTPSHETASLVKTDHGYIKSPWGEKKKEWGRWERERERGRKKDCGESNFGGFIWSFHLIPRRETNTDGIFRTFLKVHSTGEKFLYDFNPSCPP